MLLILLAVAPPTPAQETNDRFVLSLSSSPMSSMVSSSSPNSNPKLKIIEFYLEGFVGKRFFSEKHYQGFDIGYFAGHINGSGAPYIDSIEVYRAFGPSYTAGLYSKNHNISLDSRIMLGMPTNSSDISAYSLGLHFNFLMGLNSHTCLFLRYSHIGVGINNLQFIKTGGIGMQFKLAS